MRHTFCTSTPQRRGSFGVCNATSTLSARDQRVAAAPALALDVQEATAVMLSNDELIAEAIAVNYRNVKSKTLVK